MSKKSRKRNRKILGALAAGLGAMALMKGRNKGAVSTAGQAVGVDRIDPSAVTGTNYPGANKVVETAPVKVSNWISPRMKGNAPDDPTGAIAQKTRGDYARQAQINARNTAIGSPSIDNPYRAPIQRKGRLWSNFSKGGRVKGCGVAKRGLGRAMKKGRK